MNSVATLTELTPAQRLELLKMARARKLVGDRAELPPIVPAAREGRLPLSFAQERLWFIDRLEPGSAVYNLPAVAWRPGGELDQAALERALGEVVRRHEALRTVFAEVDGSPVQVVAPFGGFSLPVEDLSNLNEADREAAVRRREGEEARRAFDLSAGPLFRAVLLRLGADEHVLLLTMHHIVSDGWSLGVLQRELGALYAAYREGRESPLPELPVQYADYAVWQREQLAGKVLDRQLAYWRERLAGAPELLELPTDHPRPAVQTYRGASVPVELSPELLERLQALGRSEGATLYMTLLGAVQVLLGKYAGSEDVVVGSPIAGRTRGEVEGLIGFFVNTLVLRTDLSGNPSFREVLRRVRDFTLGAYEHQEVPFEKLVAELQPERSLSHSPLFQVMFALQEAGGGGGALAAHEAGGADAALGIAKYDLSLTLVATPQGVRGALNYSTDLFERGTVERMLGHLARVLEQVAADADVRLSRLELLGDEERALVLGTWNRTERETSDPPAHALFAEWARRAPQATALLDGGEAVTYGALDRRAAVLARHLRDLGVGPETPVGLCMERTPELLVGVLGIWKAGGAYVPLDPSYPAERLGWILADAALPVVVATGRTAGVLPEHGATLVRVDQLPETAAEAAPEVPASDAGLAYVIYTSGSTGRPKGVLVQHGSLANLLAATREAFGVSEGDVMPALASYAFDIWLFEALLPLTSGAAVRLVERERVLDAHALLEEIADATLVHAVPALMRQLVQAERETPRLARLRRAFVGGDRVAADLLAEMREALPGAESHVLYGPTEGTILASTHPVPEDGCVTGHPIGAPLGNVRLYVCDAFGNPQPAGVPGELLIGGAGVARGYLGRAGLTAERFVPDPFSAECGARLYRTGDRARWRAEGTLEFLGRTDFQVKIRGFRIEPGEIEAVLSAHAEVREARVIVWEDAPGETRLVAYVVGGVETDELREHLRRSLPEYMLPAAYVALEALPLTPNGKLDRKALPAPDFASAEGRYVAPRTPVEEVLAEIWAEMLRLERVGVTESFFELGGHSLLATRVVSRVRQVFGVELPLRALFEGPTVAELAGRVEEMRRAGAPALPAVVPTERTGALPLSFAQERLWFIGQLEPGSAAYNIPGAWRLGGALDEAALERSLGEIVRRHEALRTTFAEVDGSPVQVIAPWGGFALPVEDLSGLSQADREAAVRRRAGEEAARPFDLAAGPLFRAALLRLDAGEHVLLLSLHHIVSDGWSMGVFFRELTALYAAYRDGRESPLPELPVQYADYAVWQREQLAGEALDRQLAYWRERLAGAPELLELPTDHPRPAVQTFRGATVPVELSPELLERLQALGRSEGATLYMVLLGAFQVLLGRYAGSEDVVVGSPIAGRTRREVEELIGFFVNTLVLRTDLSENPSFREVLRRVREATLGAYEHQEVPFERLVAELQPERSLSHSPLFQVMFTVQNAGGGGDALPGLTVSGAGAELESAKFDLSLTLSATPRGLRGGLGYSTGLFERGTVERMLGHLARVLEQAAARPEARLSELDLLSAEERGLVVDAWNRTEAEYPADRCIHERFEAQAARTPGAVAVRFEEESLTYGELNQRANRLAHYLAGVRPETRVALCLERGPEMVVSVLAVLKAGGAYVPLDPAYPAERLAFMLADAAVPVLVTQESLRAALPAGDGVAVVSVDGDRDRIAAESAEDPERGARPDHLAYVIYTSGSTGTPKGVLVQHGSLANLLAATREAFGVVEGDLMPAMASYAFDIWLFEALLPLTSGAAVRLVDRERVLDVHALVEEIADATLVHAVPALMRQVVQAERETPRLARLRRAFVGGDRVPADLLAEMREALPGAETHVLYGPTEGTILASTQPVPADGGVYGHPIGRPLGNVRLYVCDGLGNPQPAGVPGELLIGGAGVARGYLGRAGLTAERFVPDPFGGQPGARLYRTGDRARWRADGTLEFLGRVDFQVKIRGFRIEPGEVEAVLSAHAEVREARVIVWEDAPGEQRLVAYVVGGVEADELREHVRRSLPEYMVPAAYVALDALPLTPNGKLDRKALPAPDFASAEGRYVAPRTPVEEVLAGIWAEVLRLERVGVEESFFELGGHSLLATRVVSRVSAVFGVELPLRALFEGPTVAALAKAVEDERRRELPVLPPVVPTERTGALPLSFAQERLWFIDRLEPGSATYNVPAVWRVGGALDERALERALGELVRRHEALRTTFAEVDGSPVQVIAPFGGFALPVEDLSGLGAADREAVARRRATEEAARPFDLAAGPLFRPALLRLGAEDHVLLLCMHHILVDQWSMGVLRRELSMLYAAYREGGESPLPELAVQYADYAVWQREQLRGEVLDRHLAYWKERLAGAPELLELPTDRPRPAVQTYRGALEEITLPGELLPRLEALGRSEGATLFMTLLAAFQVLLGRYGRSEDVVVGSPVSGRTRREVEELIGLFLNTLVLRTGLSGDPSFRNVLRRVREMTLGAFEHQEIPFERLVTELQPERSLSYSPLFQVMFVLQEAERSESAAGNLDLRGLGAGSAGTSKFDLTLFTARQAGVLTAALEYNTDLFDRGTIRRMLGHLQHVLEEVAADADVRLSRLALMEDAERRQVVAEWNATDAAYPRERCVHELFESQAERTPDAVALRHAGGSLTYAELEERANRLARHLRGLGVGPDVRVGLCLERGPELMVGVLGILKAGGAYVPLDPAYPAERLAYMLEESAARVLLTQASLVERLPAGGATVVRLDADAGEIGREGGERLRVPVGPGNLAYVIYTSGSTGRPKGVAMPHRPLVNLLAWQKGSGRAPAAAVTLQFTSISFDVSCQEIFATWCAGGTLVLTSEEVRADPPRLARLLEAERIERLFLPFIALQHLAEACVELGIAPASLGEVITAGEQLRITEPIRRWFARMPGCALVNQYGPSETHVVSARVLEGEPAGWPLLPSIGAPVANTRLYVLSQHLEPAPIGVPGELLLGGDAVARGYLERPGLTAERFVPDPFGAPGGRLYRTGDRVRWLSGGEVEYLGRTDEQVKVRGFRIEPGEVEAVLSGHPEVREAVVVVREDAPGDRRLVAYVVAGESAVVTPAELREHVRRSLPEYMVPSAVVALESLPLTPSGKVARQALPVPDFAAAQAGHVAPRTPVEEVLAGIWAEVLRLERVGAEESFFELGGHSLLATRVAARVRGVFGVELPLRAVFERPVLRDLAAEIERLRGSGAAAGEGAIAPAAREGDLPVTFSQERLWFVDALDPGSPAYAIPFSYHIAGRLDPDALRRALAELVRRHEPLRTTLPAVDGVPVQRIAPPPAGFDLPVADLRHLPGNERRAEARRLAAEASGHRFDLARGPLFRAALVHVADDEHLLLLNLHHAIGDGWSLGVLLEEFSTLYGAFARGEASPLPEPVLQYADYAVWQRERLSGATLERQVEFWRRALDGAPALLELPTDRPRPPVESHRGAVERMVVPPGLAAEVNALARREGATLFMVLLAALDVVLGRLAGQEDVVVGTPIAGRTRAETDRMVGLFLNSLALRTDLSGDPSFRELLGRVRETTLDAYAHQEVPFERVLEEVRPERSLAHAPVFQVMLNLLNFQGGAFRGEGLEVAGAGGGGEVSSKFDLTLYVGERDGGIDVSLVYAADLFDAPRMRGLLAQLEGVLRQAAAAPETRLGALSLATEAARGVLPDPAEPLDDTWRGAVHEVFAARAKATPYALAVEDPRERWTYAELHAATDRVARGLADHAVGNGDVVAITGHRSAALVRALVGTMKSGAAFLVLDPAYPAARLAEYVRIARPAAHLHLSAAGDLPGEVAALLDATIRTRVVLRPRGDGSAEDADGLGAVGEAPRIDISADTLAYLSFTSGTTGTPKAVMGRHSSLTHFTPWLAERFGLTADDRYSMLSGLAHDPLHRDVFTPLQLGAAVVAPEPDETGTPGYLARWMREAGVTVAHLTPAMGQLLAEAGEGERIDSLRRAFFVGDVLRRADVRRLAALAPNLRVVNYYGSTETQRAVSYHLVDPAAEQKEIIPLGRGIPGVQLLVRNAAGELAGVGELGEIWLRSPHLAAGYLGDAALSASRFVANPWTGQAGDRLYRTGDLGRYRPDGEVEPLGRADQQVKVRGFRVELGEVESALASHPAIQEAAVMVRETGAGDRRLVAWWVPVEGPVEPDAAALRTHLKALLPEYMVPSAYVRLDRLPLTANGKLDRRALPEPEPVATDSRPAAPRTPTEEILAQLWAEVLGTESVGVDDDFFALGGHSLLATRLLSRVQNALGVVVPLRALFEGPTVAELAARVDALRRAGLPVLPPVVPVERTGALPLSFAQERLWFIDRLEGGSAYNLPAALRLGGALDVDALERTLGEIVRRHESLRTVFREMNGGAVQVIAPFAGFALPVDDLSGLHGTARETEVRRRAREDAARPFDLAEGPLFRAALLRVADEEHVLLLCMHHIVSDGWSSGVLFRELGALYAAYREGSDSPLAELPVQYADYAVWQREQLQGEVLDRQLAYWKERLAGAPALLELPADRPRPPVQSHRGARERFDLPRALLDRLQALGRGEGATLYMVMLSAFQLLLSKYSGSADVVVGSPIAGRTRREVEELIGFFANTLVLRTDLGGDPTFRELLGRVREGTLGAYEHQEVPFERLVAELQPERSLSHAPLFQVTFTLQNADRSGSGLAGLRMAGGVDAELETTRFDLSLTAIPHDGGVHGALEYSTDLFDRSTVRRMLGHLARVLEQVAADADVRLSRLALTGPEERARVVVEWNRTERPYPRGVCVHELFDAQVRERPGAMALTWGDVELTYRELDARANRLANHLVRLGVGPESRVGVLLERSVELIVSILAVLKAGGCYVPLDPGYPPERLRLMLADSDARVLLSRGELAEVVEAGGLTVVHLDQAAGALASESIEAPRSGAAAENLAYIVYTSGSTGKPKGVMVAHRHVVQLVVETDYVQIRPGDRVAQASNASFDALTFEAWGAFLNGATLVGIPRDVLLSPPALREMLREERITTLYQTTALLNQLAREQPDVFAPLRDVLFGGQAADADSVRRLLKAGGPERLLHMYGPTETTAWCSWERVEQVAEDALTVSVGRATGNQRIYLLDAALNPVPVGVPGEAYVGGDGVVRGYLERPGLTAERFVPDPFAAEPGARMYRTGDRLRWKADGRLEFIGRVDEQVKIRGFRIEPGEIEAVLSAHAEVREARVIVREDQPGEKRLVAYVVGSVDAEGLRGQLRESLPEYMVPAAVLVLDALPLTPNGKLDRKALPAPELASAEERYVAPRTPVEEVLAGIWTEVLRRERVGVHDSFFDLGGHSLLIMRLLAKIQATFDLEISIRTVFSMPTLEAMAGEIERRIYEDVATMSEFEAEQLAESTPVAGA